MQTRIEDPAAITPASLNGRLGPSQRDLGAYPSQVLVDRGAIASNLRWIRARLNPGVGAMAVVKADAYGHGAVPVARTLVEQGADLLAVANFEEALALRDAGLSAPILVLSHVPVAALRRAIALDISVSIYADAWARPYLDAIGGAGAPLRAHLKVDTGMGRLGLSPGDVVALSRPLRDNGRFRLDGVYTHFSSADDDLAFTRLQLERFKRLLAELRAAGLRFPYVHAANSAALLNCRESHFNLARPGLLLYGLNPLANGELDGLRPALSWRTRVAQVKTLPAGAPVGYGKAYRTGSRETIAVLPVGYADGLRRSPRTWREALVRGRRAPLVGRVSMEKTTINVSRIPGVAVGDEVVLLGRQGDERISAADIAEWLGSIDYEVVTTIAPRLPRSYLPL